MQQFTNPRVERMGLCTGTQWGKTTLIQALIGYVIAHDPGPTMLVRQTVDDAYAFSRERMLHMIEDCPSLMRHVLNPRSDLLHLQYTFDRMTMRYGWANSEASLRSHSIRYLFKDESSGYPPGASSLADERTKAYWNRKIIETSTPKHPDDAIWKFTGLKKRDPDLRGEKLWTTDAWVPSSDTTVYFLHVPCVHCGKMIRFEHTGLRWPENRAIRDIGAFGWYECPECGGTITDNDKHGMVHRHQWITDNPGGRWIALHSNSIYALWPSCRFGEIASVMIRARSTGAFEDEQSFVNNWLALPYSLEDAGKEMVSDDVLRLCTTAGEEKAHHKNEIPAGAVALSMGADLRDGQVHWVVLAACQNKSVPAMPMRVAVVSWGIDPDLGTFETVTMKRVWRSVDGQEYSPCIGGLDCRYQMNDVKELARRAKWMKAVRGESAIRDIGTSSELPFTTVYLDRDAKGRARPGSLIGYRVNTGYWKQWLYGRINAKAKEGEAQVDRQFVLPVDDDKDAKTFQRHLRSEHEVVERSKGTGLSRRMWRVRVGYEANHWLDAVVYALTMLGVVNKLRSGIEMSTHYGWKWMLAGAVPPDQQGKEKKQDAPAPRRSFINRGMRLR